MVENKLTGLLREISACRLCEAHLPLGPRPVIQATASARILVIGQAPGTRVHRTGIPFNDPSGDRLRDWMGIGRETFYDGTRIAIMPMGLCYPGRNARGGDAPPRPECAPLWHDRVRALLPEIELTLLIGAYAQGRYLGERREKTLAATVARWRDFGPAFIPTPHPSPRNRNWLKTHPWFEDELVPEIQRRVRELV